VVGGLESHHEGGLENWIGVPALQQKSVDFLMEEEGEVASLNPHGESHLQRIIFVVERDGEGAGCIGDGGGSGVEFEEVFFGPGVGVGDAF
jgi:hypothetical protein